MKLLSVIGMPASGKGIVVDFYRERGFSVFGLGDAVREEAARRELDPTSGNISELADRGREEKGETVWADRVVELIKTRFPGSADSMILIDGIRSPRELESIKKGLDSDVILLAVHASPEVRYGRVLVRARQDDPGDRSLFTARDDRELGYGLGELISLADDLVVNESTVPAIENRLEEIYGRIERRWKTVHGPG